MSYDSDSLGCSAEDKATATGCKPILRTKSSGPASLKGISVGVLPQMPNKWGE